MGVEAFLDMNPLTDAATLAEEIGASVVYSENLDNGQFYGPVKVANPFLPK
jgi:predicted nucleic acid-binding protein